MLRTLAVVAVVIAVAFALYYKAPPEQVRPVDAEQVAQAVATVAPFAVLLPSDEGWTATSARWEATPDSQGAQVWFTGGVYGVQGPFAALSQSTAVSQRYLDEQTHDGKAAGTSTMDGTTWQRYESPAGDRSLVLASASSSTIVNGTGSWAELERFARSLRVVEPAQGAAAS